MLTPRQARLGGSVDIAGWALKGFALILAGLCAAAAEPDSTITVFVYNYAAVPAGVLEQAEAEGTRIYQRAGITIGWLDCPLSPAQASQYPACLVPPGPATLAVRILSRSMSQCMMKRLEKAQDSFGFALYPADGSFATAGYVFAPDAEQLANRCRIRYGVILGHLMAHEMGHLLLGLRSHSGSGIMQVPWQRKKLEIISQGSMLFDSSEGKRMRTNIRVRAATQGAADQALVRRM